MDLGRFARHGHGQTLVAFVLEHVQTVHFRQAHHHAQRTTTWNNRRLIDRIAFGQQHANQRVTGLVIGCHFLLCSRHHHGAAFGTHHDLVLGALEIEHHDKATAQTCGAQSRFVHKVCKVRTRETGRAARNDAQVHVRPKRCFAGVHTQDFLAAFDVGITDGDLTVKTSRAQQGGVQYVFAVGRRDNDHAFVGFKTVHLNQQLVQRLLTLIVATTVTGTTGPAHSVDFVDEHDAGRIFLGLFEHVAHTGCTHANEHLDKVGTRDGKERHTRLTRNGTGQKRFTGSGRALKQSTFGDLTTQAAEFLRVAQKFDDLFELFFRLINARNVVKRDATMLFGQHLGFGFAETHRTTFAATLHAVHEVNPHTDQQRDWQQGHQQRLETGLLLRCRFDRHIIFDQQRRNIRVFRLDHQIISAIRFAKTHLLAIQRHIAHFAALNRADKLRIADFIALQVSICAAEQVEQGQHQQHQNNPKRQITHVSQGNSPLISSIAFSKTSISASSRRAW